MTVARSTLSGWLQGVPGVTGPALAGWIQSTSTGTATSATGQTGTLGSSTTTSSVTTKQAVSLPLHDEGDNALISTAGFYWFWIDRSRPIAGDEIVDAGGPVSTNAQAKIIAALSNTTLALGQTGYMIVTQSDGDPGQNPGPRAWQMPVVVTTGA